MTNVPPPDVESKRPRRFHSRILSLLLFLLCVSLALEGVSRLVVARIQNPVWRGVLRDYSLLARQDTSRFRFVPDSQLSYRLKPGFSAPSGDGGGGTRHNEMGFRDDFVDGPKASGTLRILCLGGSTTYGVSVPNNDETYPAFLEEYLNSAYRPDRWERVEVYNLGVGGYTSREVLANLRLSGLALDPDVILVQSAINDVAPRFYDDFRCDYSHFRKTMTPITPSLLQRSAYRSRFLLFAAWKLGLVGPLTLQSRTQYPAPSPEVALANLENNSSDCYRQNLEEAIALAENNGIQVWLLTQVYLDIPAFESPDPVLRRLDEAYRRGLSEHNGIIRTLCNSTTAQLVDIDELMPRRPAFFKDPIHMRAAGNQEKAKVIAKVIQGRAPRR